MAQNDIDQCVNDQGANKCDEFYNIIHGPGSRQFVGGSTSTGISVRLFVFTRLIMTINVSYLNEIILMNYY